MTIYTFDDVLDIYNDSEQFIAIKPAKIPVTIVFEYYFDEDYKHWHLENRGILRILEMKGSNSHPIDIEELPIEQQINIRKLCNQFLDKNGLRMYSNIIPLFDYQVRAGCPANQNGHTQAKIIRFVENPN